MKAKTRESISLAMRFYIFRRDKFTCQYCGAKAPDTALHVEHIVPVAKGGANDPENLCAACIRCNTGKGVEDRDCNEERPPTRMERQLWEERESLEAQVDQVSSDIERIERRLWWARAVYASGHPDLRMILLLMATSSATYGGDQCFLDYEDIERTALPTDRVWRALTGLMRTGYLSPDVCWCNGGLGLELAPAVRQDRHFLRRALPRDFRWVAEVGFVHG